MITTDLSELKGGYKYSDILKTYTIYSLVNLDNCKRYIGRTKNPTERIKFHFSQLRSHAHKNKLLNADSECRFAYEILEEGVSFSDRTDKERSYIILHRTYDKDLGYNANDPCLKGLKGEGRCQKFI